MANGSMTRAPDTPRSRFDVIGRGRRVPSFVAEPTREGGVWRVRVEPAHDVDSRRARALGGRRVFTFGFVWDWEFRARDDRELADVMSALRDMGVAFLRIQHGWHAGDVFESLRERGLVRGPYRAIRWHGPGEWETADR